MEQKNTDRMTEQITEQMTEQMPEQNTEDVAEQGVTEQNTEGVAEQGVAEQGTGTAERDISCDTARTATQTAKGKPGKGWLAAACACLCLAAVAIGIVFFLSRGKGEDSEAFEAYTEEIFREDIVQNTINLHYTLAYPENYGITEYEATLGADSLNDVEENYEELAAEKKRLLSFNRESLTEEQKICYDIMLDYLDTELSAEDYSYYTELLGPTTGYQAQLPILLAEYTFRTRRDIEDYLALVAEVDETMETVMTFEREKADRGLFMSDYAADAIIEQCSSFIAEPEENYMIEVFDDKIEEFEGLSEEEKEQYRAQNRELVTTDVVAGYQTLIDGLTELKGSGTNEMGLCYYEDGKEYYEYLVRSNTGSDASPREMERWIENYLTDFIRKLQGSVTANPNIYEELVNFTFPYSDPEEILEDLQSKITEDFPTLPEATYTIKYVHSSMEDTASPAFFLTPPIDDGYGNVIYINRKYMGNGEAADSEIYPTLAHEGYPGHLYQSVYTGAQGLPLVRNLFSYAGFTEGWATYVEYEYSYDFATDDEELASLLAGNSCASLALSAYMDLGIHYEGWDRQEAADYLAGFGIYDDEAANQMYDLIVEEPANYLNYFIGYMEFLNLKEEAQEELGDAFENKEWHQFILSFGQAPFYIIEDYMQDWIETELAAAAQ